MNLIPFEHFLLSHLPFFPFLSSKPFQRGPSRCSFFARLPRMRNAGSGRASRVARLRSRGLPRVRGRGCGCLSSMPPAHALRPTVRGGDEGVRGLPVSGAYQERILPPMRAYSMRFVHCEHVVQRYDTWSEIRLSPLRSGVETDQTGGRADRMRRSISPFCGY